MELNAFEPVLFYNLFESLTSLEGAVKTLVDHCITGITANRDICKKHLEESVGIVTALCPYIGYVKSAEIAKESLHTGVPVSRLIVSKGVMNEEQLRTVLDPAAMTGISGARTINIDRMSV